ncbi:EAL domain-containing protein, partial [Pseudomonas savastanoi]|uniref:EAL domain-containing protein n=3 Tax=Pseudomonas savastanoi TaxID=29438 RepID=UPI000F009A1E
HPTFGDVPPEHFIPLAEENGMILQIGEWVLEQACQQMGKWRKTCQPFGPVSVNLAGAHPRRRHRPRHHRPRAQHATDRDCRR